MKIFNILISAALSVLFLYILGNLYQVRAYSSPSNLPTIKLILLNIFLLLTIFFSLYFLVKEFLEFRMIRIFFILSTIAGSFLLSYKIISIPDSHGYIVGFSYVLIGDYLRDSHGINIYFMDWAGWAITMVLYLSSIFSFFIFEASKKIFPKLFKH